MLWRSMDNMGCKHLIIKTWVVEGVFHSWIVVVAAFRVVGNVTFINQPKTKKEDAQYLEQCFLANSYILGFFNLGSGNL
jgi:hypothetical protein